MKPCIQHQDNIDLLLQHKVAATFQLPNRLWFSTCDLELSSHRLSPGYNHSCSLPLGTSDSSVGATAFFPLGMVKTPAVSLSINKGLINQWITESCLGTLCGKLFIYTDILWSVCRDGSDLASKWKWNLPKQPWPCLRKEALFVYLFRHRANIRENVGRDTYSGMGMFYKQHPTPLPTSPSNLI